MQFSLSFRPVSSLLLALSVVYAPVVVNAESCSQSIQELSKNSRLKSNKFTTSRTLRDYARMFPFHFGPTGTDGLRGHLITVKEKTLWVDMGAGNAEALKSAVNANPNIYGTAIGFRLPKEASVSELPKNRFKYLSGKFLEDLYSNNELKHLESKVDVITDLYGPLSYSRDIALVFDIYIKLLKVNGELSFNLMKRRADWTGSTGDMMNSFNRQEGSIYPFVLWMKSIDGIDVEISNTITSSGVGREVFQSFKITKLKEDVEVPQNIKLELYEEESPARRRFKIIEKRKFFWQK